MTPEFYKGYFMGLAAPLTKKVSARRTVVEFPEEVPSEEGSMVPFDVVEFFAAVADLETKTEGWGLFLWTQDNQHRWLLGYTEGVEPLFDLAKWHMAAEILRTIGG